MFLQHPCHGAGHRSKRDSGRVCFTGVSKTSNQRRRRWKGWESASPAAAPHPPRAGPAPPRARRYKRAVRALPGLSAPSHGSREAPAGLRRGRAAQRAAGVACGEAGAGVGAPEPPRRFLRWGRVPGAAHGAPRGQGRLPPALLAR